MNDICLVSAVVAAEFQVPLDTIFRVNHHYCESVVEKSLMTPAQFWRAVYVRYCAIHYCLHQGSRITVVLRWGNGDCTEVTFDAREAFSEPASSRTFFRLLSENSPDSVRSGKGIDWALDSLPEPEPAQPAQPAQPATYEELL